MAPDCSESNRPGLARILGSSCRLVTPFDAAVQSPQGQPPLSQRTLMAALVHGRVSRRPLRQDRSSHRDVSLLFAPSLSCAARDAHPRANSDPEERFWSFSIAAVLLVVAWLLFLVPIDASRGGSLHRLGEVIRS
ncbi:hypothetical protein V8C44DRAFT_220148 [Trichoderma aethiopicum]